MAQTQEAMSDGRTHVMGTRKRITPAHMSPQTSTEMTYDDPNSPSLEASATQHLFDFAASKGHNIHTLNQMSRQQLAELLREFYGKAKSRQEEMTMSIKDLREGLHKYFMREMVIDIVRDKTFEFANATFDIAARSTTSSSRKCHRMKMDTEDLRKIYFGVATDLNKPDSLQNKVFFDINLYICSRSKDHLRLMKKDDFDVLTDVTGRRYVCLKEMPKFSSGSDKEFDGYQPDDRMVERPGDPRCPVRSFLKYVEHLHPMSDAFWQRPKRNVSVGDYVWYDHSAMGASTLNRIMQRISLMAGMYETYTNHAIRMHYIPILESMCAEALANDDSPHDCAQATLQAADSIEGSVMRGALRSGSSLLQSQDSVASRAESSGDDDASVASNHNDDSDVADPKSLRDAKMKVLEQIQNVMVRDIPKFVDWLKSVRVEYHGQRGNQMRVLCNPVDRHTVDNSTFDQHQAPVVGGQIQGRDMTSDLQGLAIRQVEFRCVSDTFCSVGDLNPLKITVPSQDTVLLSGVPDNLQVMLHTRQGEATAPKETITERIFASENEMDVGEVAARLGALRAEKQQQQQQQIQHRFQMQYRQDSAPAVLPTAAHQPLLTIDGCHHSNPIHNNNNNNHHLNLPYQPPIHRPVQQQNSFENKTKSELIKTKKFKSMTYHDSSPVPDLKRVSSTGTPVLKRQAAIVEYGDEPMTKRAHSEDHGSFYPHMRREDSLEALRLRADRLDDSLRMHQEILQNSPLLKKQMDRHGTGFRHSYNPVKHEPKDT